MRMVPLVATAVLALSVSALSAQQTKPPENVKPPEEMSQPQSQPQNQPQSQPQEMGEAEGVNAAVLEEVTQMADAAFKAASSPAPAKTPEQIAADEAAIASHCDSLYARAHERNPDLPAGCE